MNKLLLLLLIMLCVSCNHSNSEANNSEQAVSNLSTEATPRELDESQQQSEAEKIFSSEELLERKLSEGVLFLSKDGKCLVCLNSHAGWSEVNLIDNDGPHEIFKCDITVSTNSKGEYFVYLVDYGRFNPKQLTLKNGVIYEDFEYITEEDANALFDN